MEIKHYRDGALLNTLTLQHDFARPPTDTYLLAMAAGRDDRFESIRKQDDARFDWQLDWQLGNHCCYVHCTPFSMTNTNPAGCVPIGQVPVYKPGKAYRMIVPLWDVGLNPPDGSYWIPGIGFGWRAWRSVEAEAETRILTRFKGNHLHNGQRATFPVGEILGVDYTTQTFLVKVNEEQGRWALTHHR